MKKVTIECSNKYDVFIGNGLLADAGFFISGVLKPYKICLVSDETVFALYGEAVLASLSGAGFDVSLFTFPPGERSKTMTGLNSLLEFMAKETITRSDGLVALGGGVAGDLAGFAASCYLRGIPFVQIPTTLLAAVDSSVGGKTGINLEGGKNLAGAFWQPSLVLCDCGLFKSLSKEALMDGFAEIIKYGVIADRDFFDFILSINPSSINENDLFGQIVEKCVIVKGGFIQRDERDAGERQLLNFGHTIGHAVEKLSGYEISHGRAVAVGMYFISRAAYFFGLTPTDCSDEIGRALKQYGFDISCDYTADELTEAALADKKRTGDTISVAVPYGIGDCRLEKIRISEFYELVRKGF